MSNAIDLANDGAESTAELVTCPPVPAALKPTVIVVPAPGEKPEGAAAAPSSSDSNTAGSEFQMSRCVVLRNGALLLPSVQSTSDSWFAVPLPEAQPKALEQPPREQREQKKSPLPAEEEKVQEASFEGVDVPGPADDDDDSGDENGEGKDGTGAGDAVVPSTPPTADAAETGASEPQSAARTTMTLRERRKSRTLEVRSANALDDVVVEEWELLDPHEAPEVPVRPFRRGRTYRVPKELQDAGTSASGDSSKNSNSSSNREAAAAATVRIRAPFFTEFDDLYEAEMKRRRAALSTMRREQHRRARAESSRAAAQSLAATVMGSAASAVLPATEDAFFEDPYAVMREDVGELDVANPARDDDDDDDDGGDNGGADNSGGDAFDDVWAQPLNYMDDDDDDAAHTGVDLSSIPHTVCPTADTTLHSASSLVLTHGCCCCLLWVQSTGDAVADRYQEEMRLVARINDWHARLEPVLEVQEGRRGFDVQECAIELLDTIRAEQPAPAAEAPRDVAFAHMVHGREPWEVCRYFLSSLLLMNCGNIALVSREPLEFCVKSTVPRFDAASTFQMVQQQEQGEEEEGGDSTQPRAVSAGKHVVSGSSSDSGSDSETEGARSRRGATRQRRKQHRG